MMASSTYNFHPSILAYQAGHPLQQAEILEHILGFCSFQDLKSHRQISTLWLKCSQKAWKSSSKLIVIPGRLGKQYTEIMKKMKGEKPIKRPENYVLITHTYLRANLRFWTICGNNIKYLELKSFFPSFASTLLPLIFQKCPNLKHLGFWYLNSYDRMLPFQRDGPTEWVKPRFGANRSISDLKIRCDFDVDVVGLPTVELLCHFEGLKSLSLIHGWKCYCDTEKWHRAIEIIRKHDPTYLSGVEIKFIEPRVRLTWEEYQN